MTYGTPYSGEDVAAIKARWQAARDAGVGVGPVTPACLRLLGCTLDEIADAQELDAADRAAPMAFLLRQLDAYLASREAREFPLTKLGSFLRQSGGRRKWLETAELWNRGQADKPAPPSLAEQILARDRGSK